MHIICVEGRISLSGTLPDIEGLSFLSRPLLEGESTFGPRYGVEDDQIVDKYPGKTDEEVAALVAAQGIAADVAAAITEISPVEFKLLFTPEERIALRTARATDAILQDFFDIAEDPRLTKVELTLSSTIAALDYMVSKNLLTAERAAKIKLGQRP